MNTNLDLSQVLIPANINMQESLFAAVSGDIIWKIVEDSHRYIDLSHVRNRYEGYGAKVSPELFGWLHEILCNVKTALQVEGDIDMYVINDNELNASCYSTVYEDEIPIVILHSGMIDKFTREELHFVIGHELGHAIAKHTKLTMVLDYLYSEEKPQPNILKRRLQLITQLSELEADRFGFMAMPNLHVCVSALFKLQSGLNPQFTEKEIESFLRINKERVDYFIHDKGTSAFDHPASPIRIEAIRLFSERANIPEDEYGRLMLELYDVHTKLCSSELEEQVGLFAAIGGLLISKLDGEISEQELDRLTDMLSGYYMCPISLLNRLLEIEYDELKQDFEDTIHKIIELDGTYRPSLVGYLVGFLATDSHISQDEIDFVMDCGVNLIGLSADEVIETIADTFRDNFNPSFADLASVYDFCGNTENEEEQETEN